MNIEARKLSYFNTIYQSLQKMEAAYIELEEFGVDYSFSEYFNAHLNLSDELEKTIDASRLTPANLEKYKQLSTAIYSRLQYDSPQLYSIGNQINDVFYTAYQAAEESISQKLQVSEGKKRPFFACGISYFSIYAPKYTLLGIMLEDKLFSPDNFSYDNGVIKMDTLNLNKKFKLTGQEYELYESAYHACLKVLNEKLGLEGHIEASIR